MSTKIKVRRICAYCGREFTAQKTTTKYCGHPCASRAYKARVRAEKIQVSNLETQEIRNSQLEKLKAKEYLSVPEFCELVGISRRSAYRIMERGELIPGKAGKRTVIRRGDIDKFLFQAVEDVMPDAEAAAQVLRELELKDCYSIQQITALYGIKESTVRSLVFTHKIPRIKKGWFIYLSKTDVEERLGKPSGIPVQQNNES